LIKPSALLWGGGSDLETFIPADLLCGGADKFARLNLDDDG